MNDLVRAAMASKVTKNPPSVSERFPDPAIAVGPIQRLVLGDRNHSYPEDVRWLSWVPLKPGQVRDFMAFAHEPLREAPVPALSSPDGPWVQAVVSDADPHPVSVAQGGDRSPLGLRLRLLFA